MLSWIQQHENIWWWFALLSIVSFFGTLILVPAILVRLPADYFARSERGMSRFARAHPLIRIALEVAKNLVGAVFVGAGILMLVLPGQGLLTIAVGLMLMNFPGKYHLEQWFVSRRSVLRAINWVRARAHRPPMIVDNPLE